MHQGLKVYVVQALRGLTEGKDVKHAKTRGHPYQFSNSKKL